MAADTAAATHVPVDRSAVLHPTPLVPQRLRWDCGLACVAMVASQLRPYAFPPAAALANVGDAWDALNRYNGDCTKRVTSVWTVELLHLLHLCLFEEVLDKDGVPRRMQLFGAPNDGWPDVGESPPAVSDNRAFSGTGHRHAPLPTNTATLAFATTAMDVDPSYADVPFYAEQLDDDFPRVRARFAAAHAAGWRCTKQHTSTQDIVKGLASGTCLYIVLVHALALECPCRGTAAKIIRGATRCAEGTQRICRACAKAICGCCDRSNGGASSVAPEREGLRTLDSVNQPNEKSAATASSAEPASSFFQGHFIVLCGYDPVHRTVLYRNPAAGRATEATGLCVAGLAELDRARLAKGTDEDIVTVRLNNTVAPNAHP